MFRVLVINVQGVTSAVRISPSTRATATNMDSQQVWAGDSAVRRDTPRTQGEKLLTVRMDGMV